MAATEQQSLGDFLKDELERHRVQKAQEAADRVKAGEKPAPIAGLENIKDTLMARFIHERGRLVNPFQHEVESALPTVVAFPPTYHAGLQERRGFTVDVFGKDEAPPSAYQEYWFYSQDNTNGQSSIGHRFMEASLRVTVDSTDFRLKIGNNTFNLQELQEMPDRQIHMQIWQAYITPPQSQQPVRR